MEVIVWNTKKTLVILHAFCEVTRSITTDGFGLVADGEVELRFTESEGQITDQALLHGLRTSLIPGCQLQFTESNTWIEAKLKETATEFDMRRGRRVFYFKFKLMSVEVEKEPEDAQGEKRNDIRVIRIRKSQKSPKNS